MTHKGLKPTLTIILASLALLGCEPPTPDSLKDKIPSFTREKDLRDWSNRISTFNVWGLPVISKEKKTRMPAIGKAIESRNLDTILLQEAWLDNGRDEIFENSGMQSRHDFTVKKTLGSGVSIYSQSRIERTSFRPFQLFGPVLLPDAWAIKGIGMATINQDGLPVSYFTTHLMAGLPRYENPRSPFTPEWKMEMFEVLAHVIEQTDSDAFVIGGDFNISMTAAEYDFWKKLSSLEGTYIEEQNGDCTWCEDNTWAKSWSRQIDYIFVSPRLRIEQAWVDYKEKIPGKSKMISLSDHYGVTAVLGATEGDAKRNPAQVKQNFQESLQELENELEGYLKAKIAEEAEAKARGELQTQGLDERVCLSCRVKTSLEMIEKYQTVMSSDIKVLTPDLQRVRTRLDSYFDLFE